MATDSGPYPCWEFLDCDGEVPQSRSGHTCALHKNRYLYIFGGFDGSNCFDDLYVLDLEAKSWRRIEAGGDRPAGRASHSAVSDELAGVMYIFGGSGSHFGFTNKRDLCEFCFETECWRLLSNPLEDTPSARYGQSMVAYQEGLYVWGGTHGTNYPTDMHRFDLCSKQWDYVVTTGDLPCGRYRHQAMVKDDVMYIVGGSGINRYGDVFTFHFGSSVWRKLVCTGTDLSDGRYAHSAVLRDGFIYLYGGNDGVRHDDLQQLDLETRVWSRVGVHGICPPGRDFHAAVLRKDSMVIFGGSNGMRRHNDVFEFHLAPKIPPCTLSADMEGLLDQAQEDLATQSSCDVFLVPDNGDSVHGIFCHSHILRVRCTHLYELVLSRQLLAVAEAGGRPHDGKPAAPSAPAPPPACQAARTGLVASSPDSTGSADGDPEEVLDSLLRSVNAEGDAAGEGGGHCSAPPNVCAPRHPPWGRGGRWEHGHCTWVPVGLPQAVILHFIRYLYSETTRFGRLAAEQLYLLFLAAKSFEVSRLALLCERQIKVRLSLDTVLPLLRASARDGPAAQPVQEACKQFFLTNYHSCSELRECEALGPKLLCELMRLNNARAQASAPQSGAAPRVASIIGPIPGPGGMALMPPLNPPPPGARPTSPEPAARGTSPQPDAVAKHAVPAGTLAEDIQRLLIEEIAPDFEVIVQDEVIHAHKFILVARSRYFASCILTSGMVEAQAGRLVIPRDSAMTADAFRAFLRFLYSGDGILAVLAPHTAMYLVEASSFYQLANMRLTYFCELCVKRSFSEEHVLQLFEASSRLGVDAVRSMALEFIINNFQNVCGQPAMERLDKPLLVDIIKGLAERFPVQATSNPPSVAGPPQSLG